MRCSLLVMVVFGIGCSGKAASITKVDGTKTFDKLSAEDQKQLCADIAAFGKRNRDPKTDQGLSCKMSAFFEAQSTENEGERAKNCQTSYDECMKRPPEKEQEDLDCASLEKMSCDATVNDLVGCLQEQLSAAKAVASELSCDKLPTSDTSKYSMELVEKPSAGPKCKIIDERCEKPNG